MLGPTSAKYNLWDYWQPQSGSQTLAYTCPADETFIGGNRGGGKSDVLIGRHMAGAFKYGRFWNGLIIRRKLKDMGEMRRRWDELIANGLPAVRVGGENQVNYIRFWNGAIIRMDGMLYLEHSKDYIGHQFTEISLDEAPEIPFIAQLVDRMKGSLRSPHGVPCRMFLTGNPGGPGAAIVKQMYLPKIPYGGGNPTPATKVWHIRDGETETTRVFLPSNLTDNKILTDADPTYAAKLKSISDPNLRAAWWEGRWDVFVGQAFELTSQHFIEPIWPIPEHSPIYMTFDWGHGAPFSIGWWWVDADDRVYRFAEWYGCKHDERTGEVLPDTGLRIPDHEIAIGVIQREQKMGISDRPIKRLTGHDSFNKRPNYMGQGRGKSVAEVFKETGQNYTTKVGVSQPYDLGLVSADPNRLVKIQQFRNRLSIPKDNDGIETGEAPMMLIYDTCVDFKRTVSSLAMDEMTREDLEDHQEDHQYDEAAQICMDRPYGVDREEIQRQKEEIQAKRVRANLDSVSREAMDEVTNLKKAIKRNTQIETGEVVEDFDFDDLFNDRIIV